MAFKKERMSSYVDRGNKLIADGKTMKAIKLVERGNPGAKELYEGMKKCVNAPALSEIEKVRKANRY